MGYYTHFHMEVADKRGHELDETTLKEVRDGFDAMLDYDGAFDEITECDICLKWYEHEQDMINFSIEFPNLRFVLDGEGEEPDDWWTAWFCNGKMHRSCAKVIPPDIAPPEGFWDS